MATAAPQALDRRTIPWLFVGAIVTTAPHAMELPLTLSAGAVLFFLWGIFLWWRNAQLPRRWLLVLCVAIYTLGILVEYRTLFGRDAGVAMLAGFMALKMLELKSRRDAHVIVILGYFLLLTHYFYSQSIPTGAWLLICCTLLTATLVRLSGGPGSGLLPSLRYGGKLILQALPFMLVLYVLFPRVSGPLWGLPQDAFKARTGLSDSMSLGSVTELAQSGEIAFRVLFEGAVPPRHQLYWRGPVLESFDGRNWRPSLPRDHNTENKITTSGPEYRYAITLEAHNQRWLLALDAPSKIPPGSRIEHAMVVNGEQPIQQRSRFEFTATPTYLFNVSETPGLLERNLDLPARRNPKARSLAARWREESNGAEQVVRKALNHFRQEEFFYTLRPPPLGLNSVDDFLFNTRRGFCEHYAAAFVVLMRAAGVPARVVTGYQGGERNPLDGYLVVRQSDAHAWAEVWLPQKGWVRVDPTAAVSPARIEQDISAALPDGEPLPILMQLNADWLRDLRFRWEAVNNTWNQYVLGYNPDRQRELLSRLGIPADDWKTLGALLAGLCGALLLGMTAWTLYHRPPIDPARREWNKALRYLRRRHLEVPDWEAPLALANRLEREQPALAVAFRDVAERYCAARYGNDKSALVALKAAIQALP